jgi:hypothetical protein
MCPFYNRLHICSVFVYSLNLVVGTFLSYTLCIDSDVTSIIHFEHLYRKTLFFVNLFQYN